MKKPTEISVGIVAEPKVIGVMPLVGAAYLKATYRR